MPSPPQPNINSAFEAARADAFDTKTSLNCIKAPLLVLHTREDEVVPFEQGRELYQSYQNGPKLLAEGKGRHMEYMDNLAVYIPAIKEISGLER